MQGAVKRSDTSNIYKFADHASGDHEAGSDETARKSAFTVIADNDGAASSVTKLREEVAPEDEHKEAKPSDADDALAWLKMIQNATQDLTADGRTAKGGSDLTHHFADDTPFERHSSHSIAGYGESGSGSQGLYDDAFHEDYSDERKLAQKLSYRNVKPRQAPAKNLKSEILPYVAATGVLAFLAGSAAVYFLTGSPSADVKAKASASEMPLEAPLARQDLTGNKKGTVERRASPAASNDAATLWGTKAEVQGANAAESTSSGERQGQSWSDTVATFKQFVKPEQR